MNGVSKGVTALCLCCTKLPTLWLRRVRRALCCARTPNHEIAFFSGDFVPAGGALPWRRQDGVCEADGRVTPYASFSAFACSIRALIFAAALSMAATYWHLTLCPFKRVMVSVPYASVKSRAV